MCNEMLTRTHFMWCYQDMPININISKTHDHVMQLLNWSTWTFFGPIHTLQISALCVCRVFIFANGTLFLYLSANCVCAKIFDLGSVCTNRKPSTLGSSNLPYLYIGAEEQMRKTQWAAVKIYFWIYIYIYMVNLSKLLYLVGLSPSTLCHP